MATRPISQPDIDAAAHKLISLIEDFIIVVREENAMLGRGMPASVSSVTVRKVELADALDRWGAAARQGEFRIEMATGAVRELFTERLTLFQQLMNENMTQLEAAIEASRRRIDAVMDAIRQEMSDGSSYGANGQARPVSTRTAARPGISV